MTYDKRERDRSNQTRECSHTAKAYVRRRTTAIERSPYLEWGIASLALAAVMSDYCGSASFIRIAMAVASARFAQPIFS